MSSETFKYLERNGWTPSITKWPGHWMNPHTVTITKEAAAVELQKHYDVINERSIVYGVVKNPMGYGWDVKGMKEKRNYIRFDIWTKKNYANKEDAADFVKRINKGDCSDNYTLDDYKECRIDKRWMLAYDMGAMCKEFVPTFQSFADKALKIISERVLVTHGYFYTFNCEKPAAPLFSLSDINKLVFQKDKENAQKAYNEYFRNVFNYHMNMRHQKMYNKIINEKDAKTAALFLWERRFRKFESLRLFIGNNQNSDVSKNLEKSVDKQEETVTI